MSQKQLKAPGLDAQPQQNRLLAALTAAEADRLFPSLETVSLLMGQTVNENDSHLKHAYFPTTSIVSLMYVMETGLTAEVAMVGNDGIVGLPLFLGDGVTAYRAIVHNPGLAYRLPGQLLKQEFDRAESFHSLLLRYTLIRLRQTAQTAVCNRRHTVDQQVCRWLLLSLDRARSYDLNMTQKLIAGVLGVRRESVTEASGRLERAGLIHHEHGHITVLDRAGLEARVCECYEAVKKATSRLLPEITITRGRAAGRPAVAPYGAAAL